MANLCEFDMRIVGTRENVGELISLLKYEGKGKVKGFGRTYEVYVVNEWEENGLSYADIAGDCAWSVLTSLIETASDENLITETKRLNLALEVYSNEPGFAFSEHFIIARGRKICDECADYTEIKVSELSEEELDALSKRTGQDVTTLLETAAENDGYYGVSGFGEDYANFIDLAKYLSDAASDELGAKTNLFYELRKHFITEDITSRYPESDAIQNLDSEKLDLLAGKVLASLGKNDSYFEIYWNTIENIVKGEGLIGAN